MLQSIEGWCYYCCYCYCCCFSCFWLRELKNLPFITFHWKTRLHQAVVVWHWWMWESFEEKLLMPKKWHNLHIQRIILSILKIYRFKLISSPSQFCCRHLVSGIRLHSLGLHSTTKTIVWFSFSPCCKWCKSVSWYILYYINRFDSPFRYLF